MRQADPLSSVQAGNDSASDADRAQSGAFTLEYRDNPFASFMRKIERMLDTDPAEALRMAQSTLADRIFEGKMAEKLLAKVDQIIDMVHKEEEKPDISGTFTKSVLHIIARPELLPVPEPVPALALNR